MAGGSGKIGLSTKRPGLTGLFARGTLKRPARDERKANMDVLVGIVIIITIGYGIVAIGMLISDRLGR